MRWCVPHPDSCNAFGTAVCHGSAVNASRWRRLAWAPFVLALALTTTAIVLIVLSPTAGKPAREFGFRGFEAIFVLAFGAVGAIVASRRPANPIGWLFCWVGLTNSVQL